MNLADFGRLLKEAAAAWQADNAPRLAAALAYYALFSIAPAIVVAIAIAGLIFGRQAAEGQLFAQIQSWVGIEGAEAIQTLLAGIARPVSNIIMATAGALAVLYGASNLFGQLGEALNTVWNVAPSPEQGWTGFVKSRLSAFAMVLTIGLLLLISLFVSAIVSAAERFLSHMVPGLMAWVPVIRIADLLLSFVLLTLLSAIIYKVLPNVRIAWRDVWVGAALTSFLFTLSKFLVGLYLGYSGVASAYGAAGSLIVVMLWIYYMAQVFLFGAEFTYIHAKTYGTQIQPGRGAVTVTRKFDQAQPAAIPVPKSVLEKPDPAPPASPLSPVLLVHVEQMPPVLRDQSLIPAGATYQVALSGQLDRVWQRPSWLRPFFLLMEKGGLLFAETGENIPATILITAGREANGQPYHFWRRTFHFARPRQINSKLSYDPDLGRPVEQFGPGNRLQMVWQVDFQPPLTLTIKTVAGALLLSSWRLPLPRWLWLNVDFAVTAESAHSQVIYIDLALSHPWLGKVFGYQGRFEQRLTDVEA